MTTSSKTIDDFTSHTIEKMFLRLGDDLDSAEVEFVLTQLAVAARSEKKFVVEALLIVLSRQETHAQTLQIETIVNARDEHKTSDPITFYILDMTVRAICPKRYSRHVKS